MIDAAGEIRWRQVLKHDSRNALSNVLPLGDGTAVVVGVTNNSSDNLPRSWLLKLDAAGTIYWERTYTAVTFPRDIVRTGDGMVLVGRSSRNTINLMNVDTDGFVRWERQIELGDANFWTNNYWTSATIADDQGFYFTITFNAHMTVLKTTPAGSG